MNTCLGMVGVDIGCRVFATESVLFLLDEEEVEHAASTTNINDATKIPIITHANGKSNIPTTRIIYSLTNVAILRKKLN